MEWGLKDKVVLITGGAAGIGKTIAYRFAREGSKVAICDISLKNIQVMQEEFKASGYNLLSEPCDVLDYQKLKSFAAKVVEQYGAIDILLNNAGCFPVKLFSEMSEEDWRRVLDINLTGTFLATKAVFDQMKKQGSGKIINMASAAGRVGGVGFTHYSAAKAGVIGFTKALAKEAGSAGIQVNAVAPGIIETDTAKTVFPSFALKDFVRNVPLGRLGREEDLFGVIALLCSPESNYMTGQVLSVDGGYTMI